ncbi:DUF3300 domain-containing protein [Trichloromonas sp.]|uniref:DUF3300 domain-containing protein n=1 Tax=Trichloromonas sp. TaxID=3069249 RepID=UPI002A3A9245|nr:DUF3300 domain-containing protein [Trichloromonas sp.]
MKKTASLLRYIFEGLAPVLLLLALASFPARAAAESYGELSTDYSREELAQMLAPIALYPDSLLSQVLMAATYPVEVVEADRWLKDHPALGEDELDEALLDQDWDPSVKELCHFPSVLAQMSERIGETSRIGDAFLDQEEEVMAMVQELRGKARAQGNLASTAEQRVWAEADAIIIEPTDPRVVYVPYYDPFTVYGSWWYPDYPPYDWAPAGVSLGVGLSFRPGIYFGFSFSNWSHFDWRRRYLHIDARHRPRYVHHDRWRYTTGRWVHGSGHRSTHIRHAPPPARLRNFPVAPHRRPEVFRPAPVGPSTDPRHSDGMRRDCERRDFERRSREFQEREKHNENSRRPGRDTQWRGPGEGRLAPEVPRNDRGLRLRDVVPPRPQAPSVEVPKSGKLPQAPGRDGVGRDGQGHRRAVLSPLKIEQRRTAPAAAPRSGREHGHGRLRPHGQ